MQVAAPLSRFTNLLIFVGILLMALGVALYQFNRVLQELVYAQKLHPLSWSQMQRLSRSHTGTSAQYNLASALVRGEPTALPHQPDEVDVGKEQVQGLLKEAKTYREEMEELKGRVSRLEREIKKGSYREEILKDFQSRLALLERDFKQKLASTTNSSQDGALQFFPLKDKKVKGDFHVHHYFISVLKGRGMEQGPPEFFIFPQGENEPRLLCLRGNNTSDGAQNSYALAIKEEIPTGVELVPGMTLLSDTFWDFNNPWHSMYNLLQFVYWRGDSRCSHADNLLLFHQGEYRTTMGSWIKSILQASGLPSSPRSIDALVASNGMRPPTVCFEKAVVSRSGIGGMKRRLLSRMFKEARCQARRACNIHVDGATEGDFTSTSNQRVNVTLVVRKGARGFVDEAAWQRVVKEQCEAVLYCSWSIMYVANLSFCQQVEAMSHTNILLSVHGAQLANIIFMPPGGSVMEMFPLGWLEMAGHGQYIYRNLAKWVDLQHEGYWRDPTTPPCPNSSDVGACFSHYKDQPLNINVSYIEKWLGDVIKRYQDPSLHSTMFAQRYQTLSSSSNPNVCECNNR